MPTYLKYKYYFFSFQIKVGSGAESGFDFFAAEPDPRKKISDPHTWIWPFKVDQVKLDPDIFFSFRRAESGYLQKSLGSWSFRFSLYISVMAGGGDGWGVTLRNDLTLFCAFSQWDPCQYTWNIIK